MKTNKLPVSLIQLLLIITILLQSCILNDKNEKISVENEKLLLSFDRNSGALLTFTAKGDPYPFLDDTVPSFSPWEIEITDTTGAQIIGINNAGRFRHRKTGDTAIIMEWDRFIIPSAQNLTVSTVITLEKNKSMTSWKISLDGISGMNVGKVVFPRIKIAENEGEEYLAIPEWMGQLIKGPR
jgi:hypothetical protein